jgi:hypothetical protein
MPWVGFEPTITVFEGAKTVHALDSAATVIGKILHCRESNPGRPARSPSRYLLSFPAPLYSTGSGKWRRNKVRTRNEEIGKQVHEKKKDWPQPVQRMSSERAPEQILYYQPTEKRDLGRPRRRWLEIWRRSGLKSATLVDGDDAKPPFHFEEMELLWIFLLPDVLFHSTIHYFNENKSTVPRWILLWFHGHRYLMYCIEEHMRWAPYRITVFYFLSFQWQ